MTQFNRVVRDFLEETFEQPCNHRKTKLIVDFILKCLFDTLIDNQKFCFPKGFGSLRVKELKPFKVQEGSDFRIVSNKKVVRYYSGEQVRRRLKNV